MNGERYEVEAETLTQGRIANLRGLSFDEATELPKAAGEQALVAGRKCSVTTFMQPVQPGQVLVTVQGR